MRSDRENLIEALLRVESAARFSVECAQLDRYQAELRLLNALDALDALRAQIDARDKATA